MISYWVRPFEFFVYIFNQLEGYVLISFEKVECLPGTGKPSAVLRVTVEWALEDYRISTRLPVTRDSGYVADQTLYGQLG